MSWWGSKYERKRTPAEELAYSFGMPDDPAVQEALARIKALRKQGLHRSGVYGRTKTRRSSP